MVNHDGRYFKIDGLGSSLKPKRPGGPPIWLGRASPRGGGAGGDAWMAAPTDSFDRVGRCIEMFRQARAKSRSGDARRHAGHP